MQQFPTASTYRPQPAPSQTTATQTETAENGQAERHHGQFSSVGNHHHVHEAHSAVGQPVSRISEIPVDPAERKQEVIRVAGELYRQSPDWVTFFREVLGVDGIVRRMFPNQDLLWDFEKSEEHDEIQKMLTKLRESSRSESDDREPTRVITVRLPQSLHESLKHESHERKTSMNKLCISKLLQVIDEAMLPTK